MFGWTATPKRPSLWHGVGAAKGWHEDPCHGSVGRDARQARIPVPVRIACGGGSTRAGQGLFLADASVSGCAECYLAEAWIGGGLRIGVSGAGATGREQFVGDAQHSWSPLLPSSPAGIRPVKRQQGSSSSDDSHSTRPLIWKHPRVPLSPNQLCTDVTWVSECSVSLGAR